MITTHQPSVPRAALGILAALGLLLSTLLMVTPVLGTEEETNEEPQGAALNIFKLIEGTNTRLPGAVFEVDGMEGTFVTDENGQFCITGLPKDSVWLVREIEAPEGYEIIEAEQLVEVDNDGDCRSADARFYNRPVVEEPTEEPTAVPTEEPTEEPTAVPATPNDGEVRGGNPTPAPQLPDTAVGSTTSAPAWPVALMFLMSIGLMLYARLAGERTR